MRRGLAALYCMASAMVFAVPPVPLMDLPFDGGWTQRRADLIVVLPSSTPLDVTATEFEVRDPLGALAYSGFEPRVGTGLQDHTTSSLPDAGFFTWRARGVDDAGVVSAWTLEAWFRVDGTPPPEPASLTAEVDAGVVVLTSSSVADTESGLSHYHFIISQLDQSDGGISGPGRLSLTPPAPVATTLLGPGSWNFGVHGHDLVDNFGSTVIAGPQVVAASSLIPALELPLVVRFDGGTYATEPFIPTDRVRFRVDAGGFTPTGFVVITRPRNGTAWELTGTGVSSPFTVTLPYGDQEVRISMHAAGEVTDWSAPLRVFVDEADPRTPVVSATRTGADVLLRWPATRDDSSTASGVLQYRVSRASADAGTVFPNVLNVPDASISFADVLPSPGAWTYSVSALDRAGNEGLRATVPVSYPPDRPTGLQVARAVTNAPVELRWDAAGDGGFLLVWDVVRIGAPDAGVLVGTGLSAPSFVDDAPEGSWGYQVFARVGDVPSQPAELSPVLRDDTWPEVMTPQVSRTGAREGSVSWTASDSSSGLASVELQRDGVSLGAVGSPFVDQPPDGVHRYRVVASDLAGNVATSDWSVSFETPGAGVLIDQVASLEATCGQGLFTTLTASEPVTWSLVSGPEGAAIDPLSGEVSWTAGAGDVGSVELVVNAQGATSSASARIPVEVRCTPGNYALGCACDSGGSLWLVLLVLLGRRPSPRPSPRVAGRGREITRR